MADVECSEHAGQRLLLAGFDSIEDGIGALLAEAHGLRFRTIVGLALLIERQLDEFVATFVQAIEVGVGVDPAAIDQALDEGLAEAADVHLVTATEELEPLLELGIACRVDAADVYAAFVLR